MIKAVLFAAFIVLSVWVFVQIFSDRAFIPVQTVSEGL